MQAVRLLRANQLELQDIPEPEPGPEDVVIAVEACGICGSDRHMYAGEYPTNPPVTLGHEFAGRVIATGSQVQRVQTGDLVTGDPNIACGTCPQCRNGRPNLCANLTAIGVQRDGGFAQYLVMPQAQAHKLPRHTDPVHAAFCEPLACCLHALDVASIRPGDSVAILGGGVIGLLMVQLCRLAGATTIILSTRQKPRRDLALQLGATHAIDPQARDAVGQIKAIVPQGADVALECAGVPDTFSQSIASVRRGGAAIIFGVMPQGQAVSIEPFDLLVNEIRLEGAYLNPLTHARAAALVASRTLALDSLVSRIVPLAEVPAIIASAPAQGEIKIIARPSL
ncbi:zinc-dependent alcohol dehydrogenase family protein [Devosia submarina]|uniref:zinc-dependent alcohol dehydrogenase family protein n=1 Tax=Devosia submarina TaxID=1173082 RepID=UPI000D3B1114|nr:zinc-dependent alcohol dehydrogenase family protein [Devosia submarina]